MVKNELFPVVRMHDPAFAGVAYEKVERYARSREPKDLPQIPDGSPQPITFWCRRLRRSQFFDFVEMVAQDNRRFARAFTAGVVKVTGGKFGDGWSPKDVDEKSYVSMTEEELDFLGAAFADFEDVGQVIYLKSAAPLDCTVRFQPRLTSLAVWEGNARRYAELSRADAAQSNDQHRDE